MEITFGLYSVRVKAAIIFEALVAGLELVVKLALAVPLANQDRRLCFVVRQRLPELGRPRCLFHSSIVGNHLG